MADVDHKLEDLQHAIERRLEEQGSLLMQEAGLEKDVAAMKEVGLMCAAKETSASDSFHGQAQQRHLGPQGRLQFIKRPAFGREQDTTCKQDKAACSVEEV